jgi:hypothetical protein
LALGGVDPNTRYHRRRIKEFDLSYFQLQKLIRLSSMPGDLNTQYLKSMKAMADGSRKLLTLISYEDPRVPLPDVLSFVADERARFFSTTDRFLLEKSVFKQFRDWDGLAPFQYL